MPNSLKEYHLVDLLTGESFDGLYRWLEHVMRHELLVSCAGISSAATSGLSDMIRALMIKQAPSRKRRDVQKLLWARRHTF